MKFAKKEFTEIVEELLKIQESTKKINSMIDKKIVTFSPQNVNILCEQMEDSDKWITRWLFDTGKNQPLYSDSSGELHFISDASELYDFLISNYRK